LSCKYLAIYRLFNAIIHLSLGAELLGWVVQTAIMLIQDKWEFWFEFCSLTVKFTVYAVWSSVLVNLKLHQEPISKEQSKTFAYKKILYFSLIAFNHGLALRSFWTTQPWLQQINPTWARDPIENQLLISGKRKKSVTLMNSKPEPAIYSCDTDSRYLVLTGVNWP